MQASKTLKYGFKTIMQDQIVSNNATSQIAHLFRYGVLLLVYTVASLGAEPFLMDEWGIDGAYTSRQKALSGPVGVAPVAFSVRAQTKINSRHYEPCTSQFTGSYHHTLSFPLLWVLRRCLEHIAQESLPRAWARHAAVAARLHARLQHHGFHFLVRKPEDRMAAITTVQLPEGINYDKFVERMRSKHNIMVTVGLGPSAGAAVRVGLMGSVIAVYSRIMINS